MPWFMAWHITSVAWPAAALRRRRRRRRGTMSLRDQV
jgi:hypothetical protein